jgi:hypothetical protein
MFGHLAQPSRVYAIGACAPSENADRVSDQLDLARRYRNALVELKLWRRAQVHEVLDAEVLPLPPTATPGGRRSQRPRARLHVRVGSEGPRERSPVWATVKHLWLRALGRHDTDPDGSCALDAGPSSWDTGLTLRVSGPRTPGTSIVIWILVPSGRSAMRALNCSLVMLRGSGVYPGPA